MASLSAHGCVYSDFLFLPVAGAVTVIPGYIDICYLANPNCRSYNKCRQIVVDDNVRVWLPALMKIGYKFILNSGEAEDQPVFCWARRRFHGSGAAPDNRTRAEEGHALSGGLHHH